ncbi:hypothetical protein B0T25DRAFT_45789 [Lasiosphaeria hispida]|uniref:Uncharacterized protein n=1 Tax=Lasiosphaeria hispida TaxID=260671 RepID=A0AAJ0HVI4_9PEZI|nr:hypothetical protein B0T25DRAFT_45789 [Lasiosphaeria hispida]
MLSRGSLNKGDPLTHPADFPRWSGYWTLSLWMLPPSGAFFHWNTRIGFVPDRDGAGRRTNEGVVWRRGVPWRRMACLLSYGWCGMPPTLPRNKFLPPSPPFRLSSRGFLCCLSGSSLLQDVANFGCKDSGAGCDWRGNVTWCEGRACARNVEGLERLFSSQSDPEAQGSRQFKVCRTGMWISLPKVPCALLPTSAPFPQLCGCLCPGVCVWCWVGTSQVRSPPSESFPSPLPPPFHTSHIPPPHATPVILFEPWLGLTMRSFLVEAGLG